MKKQILTLTMCLALTATAGLASGTMAMAKAPTKAPAKIVKKVVTKTTPVANKQATPEVKLTPEQARQQFEAKMAKERDNFYNKLGLSVDQKTKAEALDKKNREAAEPLFDAVRAEKTKLHELQAKKACRITIYRQEQKLNSAKKVLIAHMDASRKAFEGILTKDQLAKFKSMKPSKKFGCGCPCHHHHHGQHAHQGPQGPDFGPHGPGFGPQHGPAPIGPAPENAPAPAPCPCGK